MQTTSALTAKIVLLAAIATLLVGGLIAVQMAAGSDPTLGPKAAARAKKASVSSQNGSSSSSSTGTDPYTQSYGYGDDGYSSGDSSGYSSGSTQQYSPPPVTSSTS